MPSNLPLLEEAVHKLQQLVDEVVFVDGATLDLMITDPGASPVRTTTDVDVIVEIMTYADYVITFQNGFVPSDFPKTCGRKRHGADGYIMD